MLPGVNFQAHWQNFRRRVDSVAETHTFERQPSLVPISGVVEKPKRVWDGMETVH